MIYHGGVGVLPEDDGTMSEQDRALVNDFILDEAYRDYDPADRGIRQLTYQHVCGALSLGRFPADLFSSAESYPGDMINAALAVDAGFLSP